MAWQVEYWLLCDNCGTTFAAERTKGETAKHARAEGWHVRGKHALCEGCKNVAQKSARKVNKPA